jgi:endogenous inhibitor of DNA gyrase (YacG/DUF329 family)
MKMKKIFVKMEVCDKNTPSKNRFNPFCSVEGVGEL